MVKSAVEVPPSDKENEKYLGKSIDEMRDNPAPKAEEILGSGVLIKGSKACIYANAKVGKSLLAIQGGLCCASGMPFLGVPVIYPCNVLYLNFELDDRQTEDRIWEIKNKLNLEGVPLPKFRKISLLGEDVPLLDTQKGFDQVAAILEMQEYHGFKVELLIWDCRYKTIQQSENQDDVMKKWTRNMEELIKRYHQFTLMAIHHKGKDTKGAGAGSSVFDRWINTSIELRPRESKSALSHSKERKIIIGGNYTAGLEICTLLEYPIHVLGGEEVWKKPLSQTELSREAILNTLNGGVMGQDKLEAEMKEEGHSRWAILVAMKELATAGAIIINPDPTKPGNHNLIQSTLIPSAG